MLGFVGAEARVVAREELTHVSGGEVAVGGHLPVVADAIEVRQIGLGESIGVVVVDRTGGQEPPVRVVRVEVSFVAVAEGRVSLVLDVGRTQHGAGAAVRSVRGGVDLRRDVEARHRRLASREGEAVGRSVRMDLGLGAEVVQHAVARGVGDVGAGLEHRQEVGRIQIVGGGVVLVGPGADQRAVLFEHASLDDADARAAAPLGWKQIAAVVPTRSGLGWGGACRGEPPVRHSRSRFGGSWHCPPARRSPTHPRCRAGRSSRAAASSASWGGR